MVDINWRKTIMSPTMTLKMKRSIHVVGKNVLSTIQLPPLTINAMFNLVKIELPPIAMCFLVEWMESTWKEMLPFWAWEVLTCMIHLVPAYKRFLPIWWLQP